MRTTPEPNLQAFYDSLAATGLTRRLIELARDEDLGSAGDVTSQAITPADAVGAADIVLREPGVVAGLAAVPEVLDVFAPRVTLHRIATDGQACAAATVLATLRGPSRELLAAERTILNLIGRLSGIATRTAAFVQALGESKSHSQLCDTRKTTPGLRAFEKYAVRCGGGFSHRMGLHDAVLIKDNHISDVPVAKLREKLTIAARAARNAPTTKLAFVEVEVDSLDQLREVLAVESGLIDIVLLDNMNTHDLREAVERRNQSRSSVLLEASGGVTLDTIRAIAGTGVDRVSVGSLTHGARSLDVGLDWK